MDDAFATPRHPSEPYYLHSSEVPRPQHPVYRNSTDVMPDLYQLFLSQGQHMCVFSEPFESAVEVVAHITQRFVQQRTDLG
jgi:hypothetical protein